VKHAHIGKVLANTGDAGPRYSDDLDADEVAEILAVPSPIYEELLLHRGRLPVCDDGSLALVVLDAQRMKDRGIEYHGQPLVVSRWSGKLKTTVNPMRLDYDDVVAWRDVAVVFDSPQRSHAA
jgi:hypothetical protein